MRAGLASGVVAMLMWAVPAQAQSPACSGDIGSPPEPKQGAPRLTFGIYPGGQAGQVFGPPAEPKPDDPEKIRQALDALRGSRAHPLVPHVYLSFTGDSEQPQRLRAAQDQVGRHVREGHPAELVLTYRPAARRGEPDVAAFVDFTGTVVGQTGHLVRGIQVMNEVNNDLSPDASDGAYPGARDALPRAIIAAAAAKRSLGYPDLEIGMNWFYRSTPEKEYTFWQELGQKGGAQLREALDWVGLDAYPGTFFPPGNRYREAMVNAMSVLRECYMPLAGLGPDVPIHVSENGYPTGPGRSYDEQAAAANEMVQAVHDFRGNYNVTDYRWFDLRDGNSEDPSFQQQYGLMRDDYTPKPAFDAYRALVERLSCTDTSGPATRTPDAGVYNGVLVASTSATDSGCATGVERIEIAVARAAGHGRCRFVQNAGKLSAPRPCRRPVVLRGASVKVPLPRRGRYRVTARGYDNASNKGRPSRARVVRSS